jgi:hypothetical protein
MDFKITIYLLACTFFMISCSKDGDSTVVEEEVTIVNYYPLKANSYWTYNNMSDQGVNRDSIYVAGTQGTNTNLDALPPANGLMTTVLSGNSNVVRTTETQLILNGELSSPIDIEGFPDITIPLNDVILYDTGAAVNTELSSISGVIVETISNIPLNINYVTSTKQAETLSSYTVAGQSFNDVIVSKVVLNLAIIAEISIGTITLEVPLLSAQDILVVTNYYAANVGLIYSESHIEYHLEDLSATGIELPIPPDGISEASQAIDTYVIGD